MPGLVVSVAVTAGDTVKRGQKLLTLEAMKMETTLYAEHDGRSRRGARQSRHASRGGGVGREYGMRNEGLSVQRHGALNSRPLGIEFRD